jgi:hypothetical protein
LLVDELGFIKQVTKDKKEKKKRKRKLLSIKKARSEQFTTGYLPVRSSVGPLFQRGELFENASTRPTS